MTPPLVSLVTIAPHLLSSRKDRRTGSRLPVNGGDLLAPGTALRYRDLAAAVLGDGGDPLQLTEAYRSDRQQADARARYDLWVRSGRPLPVPPNMSSAFAAQPGRSNHAWGGAVDINVHALRFPGCGMGSDESLARFWELARRHHFYPIISDPHAGQSEAWHFDARPPALLRIRASVAAARLPHYTTTHVAIAAIGFAAGPLASLGAHAQARLWLSGHPCGQIDGLIGPKTRAAANEAVRASDPSFAPPITGPISPATLLAVLRAHEVGTQEIAEL